MGTTRFFLFFNEKYGVYLINVNKIDYIGQRLSSKKLISLRIRKKCEDPFSNMRRPEINKF